MQRVTHGSITLPYSEVLRVIGRFVENADLAEVRIVESDEALIVQGRVLKGARAGELDTFQLTMEDVEALLQDALAQRGVKL